jgi:hypothetical protein
MSNTIKHVSSEEHGMIVLNPDGTPIATTLPTGSATSANQDTQTTLLQGIAGMIPSAYDYISQTIGATSKTFIFKTGGAGGTTVSTITVNYTDVTLSVMSSVVKT